MQFIESQPGRILGFVLNSKKMGGVSRIPKNLRKMLLVLVHGPIEGREAKIHQSVALRVATGHHAGPTGTADWGRCKIVAHPDAISGQRVAKRRSNLLDSIATQSASSIVGCDDQDVWALAFHAYGDPSELFPNGCDRWIALEIAGEWACLLCVGCFMDIQVWCGQRRAPLASKRFACVFTM
jgi:hypothetical protein